MHRTMQVLPALRLPLKWLWLAIPAGRSWRSRVPRRHHSSRANLTLREYANRSNEDQNLNRANT